MSKLEVWLPIAGAEGLYEVSNLGRVRSLDRTYSVVNNGTMTKRLYKGVVLKPSLSCDYPAVFIRLHHQDTNKKKRVVKRNIHRLVAEAFIENPDGLPVVNHLDGNKHNSKVSNLEWTTDKGNKDHASKSGLISKGEDRYNAILNDESVKWIRENAKSNGGSMSYREIAKAVGVSRWQVSNVAKGLNWKHVD